MNWNRNQLRKLKNKKENLGKKKKNIVYNISMSASRGAHVKPTDFIVF